MYTCDGKTEFSEAITPVFMSHDLSQLIMDI